MRIVAKGCRIRSTCRRIHTERRSIFTFSHRSSAKSRSLVTICSRTRAKRHGFVSICDSATAKRHCIIALGLGIFTKCHCVITSCFTALHRYRELAGRYRLSSNGYSSFAFRRVTLITGFCALANRNRLLAKRFCIYT